MARIRTAERSGRADAGLSLLQPKAMGGLWSRKGMRFQDLWLVHEATGWATDPLFRGFVNEGTEDVEAFWFTDEKCRSFRAERWQLKNRLADKALLAQVLADFRRQHQSAKRPPSRFHLVAPSADPHVVQLPAEIERTRQARVIYGDQSDEYVSTLRGLQRRLKTLGIRTDAEFVIDAVDLDFTAGWVQPSDSYWRTLRGLLLGLDVHRDRTEDAANRLLTLITTTHVGGLIDRALLLERLSDLQASDALPVQVPGSPPRVKAPQAAAVAPAARPAVECRFSFFPEGSVVLRLGDGTCGVVDCGPDAARHIISHLLQRGIRRLAFIAVSHWHYQHCGGLHALLSAMERVDHVWLATDPGDMNSPAGRRLRDRLHFKSEQSAQGRVLADLHRRAQAGEFALHAGPGLQPISGEQGHGETSRPAVIGLAPGYDEYLRYGMGETANNLSGVYLVQVGERQLLLGGHAQVKRWKYVLSPADTAAANVRFHADAFLLPHFGSRLSLSTSIIKALVNPHGFTAILPTSPIFQRPKYQIPDEGVLNAVRAASGRLVVCGQSPSHFLLNDDGFFENLSVGPAR